MSQGSPVSFDLSSSTSARGTPITVEGGGDTVKVLTKFSFSFVYPIDCKVQIMYREAPFPDDPLCNKKTIQSIYNITSRTAKIPSYC